MTYCSDDKPEFAYEPFRRNRDFGPMDLARTVMYCRWVDALCSAHADCSSLVHVASTTSPQHRANSALLCMAYSILADGLSAEEAFEPFADEDFPAFLDCRGDSAEGSAIQDEVEVDFCLSMLDVLHGLLQARDLHWIDYRTFSIEDHVALLRPENGDQSWLLPGCAIGLASPWAAQSDRDGLPVCTPELLAPFFLAHDIRLVIQCNRPEQEEDGERRRLLCYDAQQFEQQGIRHVKLPFEDGGCPSIELLLEFLDVVNRASCSFAVHCRSGLGRTATVIGAYAMQTYGFTARGFIGWARLMRPGTVHGCQQQFLVNLESHLRPGVQKALMSLNPIERLLLLPRRELRFHALDVGLEAAITRPLSELEIADLILKSEARSLQECRKALPRLTCSISGLSAAIAAISSTTWSGSLTVLEEFEELLRYLKLLFSLKDDSSWRPVASLVEELRGRHLQALSEEMPLASREAKNLGDREIERKELQLQEAADKTQELERATQDLRRHLEESKSKAAKEMEQMALQDRDLANEKIRDEQRLGIAEEHLQSLRARLLKAEGSILRPEVQQEALLRGEAAEARLTVLRLSNLCKEQRQQIAAMQEELRHRS